MHWQNNTLTGPMDMMTEWTIGHQSLSLSICLFFYLSFFVSVSLSVCPSFLLSLFLSDCRCFCLFSCLSDSRLVTSLITMDTNSRGLYSLLARLIYETVNKRCTTTTMGLSVCLSVPIINCLLLFCLSVLYMRPVI